MYDMCLEVFVVLTISISDDLKASMNEFDEINWSGFIRNKIKEK